MALSAGIIAAIVVGSICGILLFLFLVLLAIRIYMRRITAGSDIKKQLNGKTVVITGI